MQFFILQYNGSTSIRPIISSIIAIIKYSIIGFTV